MPSRSTSARRSAALRRVPRTLTLTAEYVESLKQYSRLLLDGGLAPGDVKRPEQVAARIEVGRDVGLSPTQAIAWVAIVNGRPSIYGDAALGMIRSSGLLADGYPQESYEGTPGEDDYAAVFTIRRKDGPERTVRFSIADAKRARLWGKKGPWTEYPERMLMWRAKGWACRDEFQDVLCGLIFTEEAEDIAEAEVVSVRPAKSPPALTPGDGCTLIGEVAAPPVAPAPVTDAQLDRLADLRGLMLASRNLSDTVAEHEAEIDSLWLDVLKPYQISSARDLTSRQADELINRLGKAHDPFTHPPEPTTGPPADPTPALSS